jgi:hypothetical protein
MIGLNDIMDEGVYMYTDGSPVDFVGFPVGFDGSKGKRVVRISKIRGGGYEWKHRLSIFFQRLRWRCSLATRITPARRFSLEFLHLELCSDSHLFGQVLWIHQDYIG